MTSDHFIPWGVSMWGDRSISYLREAIQYTSVIDSKILKIPQPH
ncbi:hypothetical protein [Chroococcidiopsis sp.]